MFLPPVPVPTFGSLVVDHLASNGLLQSLAVFLPESGLGTNANTSAAAAALSREDVLQALSLPADSALFRRVISRAAEEEEGGGHREAGQASPPAPGAAGAVVLTASAAAVSAGEGGGQGGGGRPAGTAGGGGGGSQQQQQQVRRQQQQEQRRVCGLLEALVGEVAARSRAVAVDCNTQTEEAGRSHKENLGKAGSTRTRTGGGGG